MCADAVARGLSDTSQQGDLPIGLPLLCTGEATNLKLRADGFGWGHAQMTLFVDGQNTGSIQFHIFPWGHGKTLEATVGHLSSGVHEIRFTGSRVDLRWIELEGAGATCSFGDAPNFDQSLEKYTSKSLDVMNRVFHGDNDYSEGRKRQLFFASESRGTNRDGSISATATAEGMWTWMLSYSQVDRSMSHDPWLNDPSKLWEEAEMTPYPTVSLGNIPGRTGQTMTIVEPCNTVSNLFMHQAAVWIGCMGFSFSQDEYSSILAALNTLAGGSSFYHACACDVGGRGDTLPIDWMMYQVYQIMVKKTIQYAGSSLSAHEVDTIMYMNSTGGRATDLARHMTHLFSQKYDRVFWNETVVSLKQRTPEYLKSITGVVAFGVWALEGNIAIPGLATAVQAILTTLIDLFSIGDQEWWVNTYMPTVRKALGAVHLCGDATTGLLTNFVKFAVTFIEALVFQEKTIPTPPAIRDLLRFLDSLGITSESLEEMTGNWDFYRGFDCKARSDHATWHEKAAHGFTHIMWVADILNTRVVASSGAC